MVVEPPLKIITGFPDECKMAKRGLTQQTKLLISSEVKLTVFWRLMGYYANWHAILVWNREVLKQPVSNSWSKAIKKGSQGFKLYKYEMKPVDS